MSTMPKKLLVNATVIALIFSLTPARALAGVQGAAQLEGVVIGLDGKPADGYTMHLIGNTSVHFDTDGNGARSRTYCINPMGFTNKDGSNASFTCYVHYVDKLVRTDAGWRIAERVEQDFFLDGSLPGELEIPQ